MNSHPILLLKEQENQEEEKEREAEREGRWASGYKLSVCVLRLQTLISNINQATVTVLKALYYII